MGPPKTWVDYTYVKADGGYHEADAGRSTQPWAMTQTGVDEAKGTSVTLSTPMKSLEEAYTIERMRRQGYKYIRARFDKELALIALARE
eukprot:5899597-Heterocapsa_arctica.AAC.1